MQIYHVPRGMPAHGEHKKEMPLNGIERRTRANLKEELRKEKKANCVKGKSTLKAL